jgi:hypothetical protein
MKLEPRVRSYGAGDEVRYDEESVRDDVIEAWSCRTRTVDAQGKCDARDSGGNSVFCLAIENCWRMLADKR